MPTWPNRSAEWYLEALTQVDMRVRVQAAAALAVLRDERAVAPLIIMLGSDPVPEVRARAVQALGQLGDMAAVEPLGHALRTDSDTSVRLQAIGALGRFRVLQAAAILLEAEQDSDRGVSTYASMALGQSGDLREQAWRARYQRSDDE